MTSICTRSFGGVKSCGWVYCDTRKQRHVLPYAKKDEREELTLNPVELGRRSRQAVADAWFQVTKVSNPRSSFIDSTFEGDIMGDLPGEVDAAQAPFTRVLVVGGTGRVGRIVTRKLLLRGYPVRVMCRDYDGQAKSILPSTVEIVRGDVGNIQDCLQATKGVDKVIYCATSKLQLTGDINKVDNVGVSNVARAWIDGKFASAGKAKSSSKASKRTVAKFSKQADQDKWDLLHVGPTVKEFGYQDQDFANALITEDQKRLCFQGQIFSRSGLCEWGGPCGNLTNCEALIARVLGDGKPYLAVMQDEEGNTYTQRFLAPLGFSTVWLPFNKFRAESPSAPPLRPGMLQMLKFRFDKSLVPADWTHPSGERDGRAARNTFCFEIAYLKAQRRRTEPTMVLVSCAKSAGQENDQQPSQARNRAFAGLQAPVVRTVEGVNSRRVALKRSGEYALRVSGLGYCIVRPSALFQEPGGYKALVFDQGDRIQQGIGYADLADVCLRALHASEAVNKTFEVCYEAIPEDNPFPDEYELVAHMPDKANNYLKQALVDMERNT